MITKQITRWHVFPDAAALQAETANLVVKSAAGAIADHGRFDIVLAGGTTPRAIHELLRSAATDWSRWHVWFGDERCLPPQDAERNSLMAAQALLDHVPIPAGQVHVIPAEFGAVAGAEAYNAALNAVGSFDLVLLGIGEDAHTASLFPGHTWDHNPPTPAIPVRHAPKPPADRVSLSASRLSDARQVIFLVTGVSKRHAVTQWKGSANIPVKAVTPANGVDVFVDAAANDTP